MARVGVPHAIIRRQCQEELMEAMWIGILGTAGTILSTVSLMPQVVKTWRTRSTADISTAWLVVALIAMVVWIAYGSMIGAPAIITVNVLLFFQCSFILYIKLQNLRAAVAKRS
jgi:MtN3 and saliva related transmembrane protein